MISAFSLIHTWLVRFYHGISLLNSLHAFFSKTFWACSAFDVSSAEVCPSSGTYEADDNVRPLVTYNWNWKDQNLLCKNIRKGSVASDSAPESPKKEKSLLVSICYQWLKVKWRFHLNYIFIFFVWFVFNFCKIKYFNMVFLCFRFNQPKAINFQNYDKIYLKLW